MNGFVGGGVGDGGWSGEEGRKVLCMGGVEGWAVLVFWFGCVFFKERGGLGAAVSSSW